MKIGTHAPHITSVELAGSRDWNRDKESTFGEGSPLDNGVRPKHGFGTTGKHLHGVRERGQVCFVDSTDHCVYRGVG